MQPKFNFTPWHPPGERRSTHAMVQHGIAEDMECGTRVDEEENGSPYGHASRWSHQMCSFLWADNYWIMSHSKMHSEQMLKEFIEEAGRWDLEPKPASLWLSSTCAKEDKEDMMIKTKRAEQVSLLEKLRNSRVHLHPSWQITRKFGRTNAESQQSTLERCKKIHKQRRAMEIKMHEDGGASLQRFLLWLCKLVMEPDCYGQEERMGDKKKMRRPYRFRREAEETSIGYCTRTARATRSFCKKMKSPFVLEMFAEV